MDIPSEETPSPGIVQDTLEAESRKYSSDVAIVLPLHSGFFAIFNAQRRLLEITASMEVVALRIASAGSTVEAPPPRTKSTLSLEDLGL